METLTPAAKKLASDAPSFRALKERTDAGTLRIVFVLGLPRGGTTATERFLYWLLPLVISTRGWRLRCSDPLLMLCVCVNTAI